MARTSVTLLLQILLLQSSIHLFHAEPQFKRQQASHVGTELPHGWVNSVRYFVGVPIWRWYSHVWVDRTVTVTCPVNVRPSLDSYQLYSLSFRESFQVYTSSSVHGLQEARDARRSASCGLLHFLKPLSEKCRVSLSPFQDVYVAVEIPPGWLSADDAEECAFETEERLSTWRPLCGLVGAALFVNAALLSHSLAFRLCAGTASFVLLSALIVAFIIYRHLPNRKLLLTGSMLAASFPMLLQYIAETWFPGVKDVTSNQMLIAYIAITALAGLAVTYYYDNPGNVKLLTILECAIRGLGLLMVYLQTSSPSLGSTAAALMVSGWLAGRLGLSPSYIELAVSAVALKLSTLSRARWGREAVGGGVRADMIDEALFEEEGEAAEESSCQTTLPADCQPSAIEQPRLRSSPFSAQRLVHEPPKAVAEGATIAGRFPFSPQRRVGRDTQLRPPTRAADAASLHQPLTPLASRGERTPSARGLPYRDTPTPAVLQQSPLVQRGLILNVESGRTIGIGKGKYNQLISKGYIVDTIGGTLTPPPKR